MKFHRILIAIVLLTALFTSFTACQAEIFGDFEVWAT